MRNLAETLPEELQSQALSSLQSRIARLARPDRNTGNGQHVLRGETGRERFLALLEELDETVLPRVVTVADGGGMSLSLVVMGRRLKAISNPDAPECSDPVSVRKYLWSFIDRATQPRFISIARVGELPGVGNGLAISSLSDGSFEGAPHHHDTNPVPGLFRHLQNEMLAWVTLNQQGQPLKQGGESAWTSRLVDLVETELSKLEAQRRQAQTSGKPAGCVLLSFGGQDGVTLLYARSDRSGFVALVATKSLARVQLGWAAQTI